ncbi:hypothetical protein CISIN_1g048185mg [Citrus sinensis]|uniref:Uncharacterized protein n=1 Tax=Citrus sinensis TaxID=2711 RepID=A0A067DC91_CITSI|nr:hypothetical protein CISIN_1g048185mg [Citrus sinensis]
MGNSNSHSGDNEIVETTSSIHWRLFALPTGDIVSATKAEHMLTMNNIIFLNYKLLMQIFYLHNVAYDNVQPDRNILPITFWNESRIKKFMKWLRSKGGIGSDKRSTITSILSSSLFAQQQQQILDDQQLICTLVILLPSASSSPPPPQ